MLSTALRLPQADGSLAPYVPSDVPRHPLTPQAPPRSRIAYAAAHVVADPLSPIDPHPRRRHRLGRDARLSPPSVVARLRATASKTHATRPVTVVFQQT
jgi:hypothetical protein